MIAASQTNADARSRFLHRAFLAAAILLAVIATETLLLSLSTGHAVNALALPLFDQWSLLVTLWGSNPAAALSVTAQQALLIIEHRVTDSGLQIWGAYYFPVTLVVYLVVAWIAAGFVTQPTRYAGWRRWGLASGAVLLALSVTYIRLASCCTVAPRWSMDILLLAQALDPTSTLINWQALYALVEPLLPATQATMGIGGTLLLFASAARRPRTPALPPAARRHAD